MSIQTINIGGTPNDGTGDALRTAFVKANENFAELDSLKATKDSPTFTGPVSGITKAMVGLPYAANLAPADYPVSAAQQAALDARILAAARGSANGVASLDAGGKVPESQLPAIAITDVFAVASQAAMLALTAERGDIAVRSDLNKTFALAAEPASALANWVELRTPTDAVLSVAGKTGAVVLVKADVGLPNVDNTADSAKPVSTAQAAAIAARYGKDNILGAVSQSAGVPTGALMEHGVNANGEYWRYAGGMQICIASVPVSVTFSAAQGAVYQSGSVYGGTPLPATFAAAPVGTVEFRSSSGTCWENLAAQASTTNFGSAYLMSASNGPQTGLVQLTAIGRWYTP